MNRDTRNELAELILHSLNDPANAGYIETLKKYCDAVDTIKSYEITLNQLNHELDRPHVIPLLQSGLFQLFIPSLDKIIHKENYEDSISGSFDLYNHQNILSLESQIDEDFPYIKSRAKAGYEILQYLLNHPISPDLDTITDGVLKAAYLFNHGLYFETHEILEEIWLEETGNIRPFLQGIIQVAVGFHHLLNNNYIGAVGLTRDGLNKLRPFAPVHHGMDVQSFIKDVDICRDELEKLSKETVSEFDRTLIPQIIILANY